MPSSDLGLRDPADAGSPTDFRRVYIQYFDRVFGMIVHYGIGQCEAEDLAQQVFVVAHQRMAEAGRLESPEAWLHAITVRVVHQHYRWRKVRRVHAWLVERTWAARSTDERTPERSAADSEALGRVQWVLGRMTAKLRDALVLVEIEELCPREAAQALGIPVNTVRSRRALARAEFRRLWQQYAPARTTHDE
jgi:RNA polymerase sigma-70 factor (ECF subfamily)